MSKVVIVTSRDALPEAFWELVRPVVALDPCLIFHEGNITITLTQENADGAG